MHNNISRRAFTGGAAALGLSAAFCPSARAGSAWTTLPTEPYKGKQDDIHFIDPDHGWYGNGAGKLFRTADGGANWEKVFEKPGTFIRALGFLDADNGFIGNVGVNYYPGVTDPHPLYRTRDAGASWEPVEAAGIEKVAGICGIDIIRTRRIFQGEMREVAIIHAAGRVGGPAALLRSEDGGETWRVIDLSADAGMILDVKFLTPMTGFLAASGPSATAEGDARILRTADGGATWTPVYQSGRKLENCWKMSWPSARVGYATVQSYDETNLRRVVIKTKNGGRSWKELDLVEAPKMQEFGVGFVDEKRGFVGCAGTGFETRDGGKSWSKCDIGRAVNKIRIVRDANRARAYAIGLEVRRLDL